MSLDIFGFILCRDTKVVERKKPLDTVSPAISTTDQENESTIESKETERDKDVESSTQNIVDNMPSRLNSPKKSWPTTKKSFRRRPNDEVLHVSSIRADFAWTREVKGTSGIKKLLRRKTNELNKIKENLVKELKTLIAMRAKVDNVNAGKSPENLPDLVSHDQQYGEGDFLRDFRRVFDETIKDFPRLIDEYYDLKRKYSEIMNISKQDFVSDDSLFGVDVQDSKEILSILKIAKKLAIIEYKLNECTKADRTNSTAISDLENVLLELQHLKIENLWNFNIASFQIFANDLSEIQESTTNILAPTIRSTFQEIFPVSRIARIERDAKLTLAEFHIHQLDIRHQITCARFQLSSAVERRTEIELIKAIETAKNSGLDPFDASVVQAELVLTEVKEETHKCRSELRLAIQEGNLSKIRCGLKEADNLHISQFDSVILEAKRIEKKLHNRTEDYKKSVENLKKVLKSKDYDLIETALIKTKTIRITSESNAVEEAVKTLTRLQKSTLAFTDENVEKVRIEVVEKLKSTSADEVAKMLVKAQVVGLNNCIEVMAAKSRLCFLQGDDHRHEVEIRKIEEHVKRIISKANCVDCTVNMIFTLQRAVVVCEKLGVNTTTSEDAKNSLKNLQNKRDKVKMVKEELQRSVMECRQEAIECAISEAESLSYFLSFDPMDGQLSAILEYAKNKVKATNEENERVNAINKSLNAKNSLKRAMRGRSSKKLKAALSLFKKFTNVDSIIDKTDPIENNDGGCTPSETDEQKLIRRAEKKIKRLEREEELAEKEWKELQENLRNNLKSALATEDRAELWKAVHQFKRELGSSLEQSDKELLDKATTRLYDVTIKQFRVNVQQAICDRDCGRLKHVLSEIDSPSHSILPIDLQNGQFAIDLERARKLLVHLKEMNKWQKSVSEMTRSQIAELHSYPCPPTFVRDVMTSVYILLGENERDVKEWSSVMRLMVKMGRESLTRRVGTFQSKRVTIANANRVKLLLSGFSFNQVQDVSRGAAVFYAWCKCVVTEVLDRNFDPIPVQREEKKRVREPAKEIANSDFWNRLSRPRSVGPGGRANRLVRMRTRPTSAMR